MVDLIFPKKMSLQQLWRNVSTQSLLERDCAMCAVYLRENIKPLLSRPTHFAHAGLARNVLKNL